MTDREYRAREGISRSELWRLNPDNGGTPEKFRWAQEHPEEPTPALIFGRLVHKLLLEPDGFDADFAIWAGKEKRSKAGKEAYDVFCENKGERQEVSSGDYMKAADMIRTAKEAPFVAALLSGAEREKPLFWTDAMTGEVCKVRLDALTEIGGVPVIVDYKTAQDASLDGFTRHAIKYGYDFQAGMYCEAVEITTGKAPRFVFIVQEKEAPYAVNIVEADELFIQRGKDKFRELLGIYHECRQTGNWYGYMGPEPVIAELSLPAWAGGN
ncbi:PD-(D/E)XK nuclease-like domain-containing protein [bacterium]|nr:PD-(D/E)XK nuclease-like domain-containing protein [bacterium]